MTVHVARRIPLSVPVLEGNEQRYLQECVETNWVSYVGPFVQKFELALASAMRRRHAVAVNSGTSALHVALMLAGVRPGDLVLMPDLTFIATANAVRYCGADPLLVDVDERWHLDADRVSSRLRAARQSGVGLEDGATGRRIGALLPVDLLGHAADMRSFRELADAYGLPLIEDASEALGVEYAGQPVGRFADMACLSFNGNKIVTSGGGGAVVTDAEAYAERALYLTTQARDAGDEYVHGEVGYNYRLTNIQAAVGLAQVEQLRDKVDKKRAIAMRYIDGLSDVRGISALVEDALTRSSYWLFTIRIARNANTDRLKMRAALSRAGIEARPLWVPVHRQSPFADSPRQGELQNAESIYDEALSLPSSPDLTEQDQARIIDVIRRECGD